MSRERREYWQIRFGLIGGLVTGLFVLWTIVVHQLRALTPAVSDCGCSMAPAVWPGEVVAGTIVVAAVATLVSVRFAVAVFLRVRRHGQLSTMMLSHSRRVWHHGLGRMIYIREDGSEQAMTIGFFKPRILVTTGLVRRLSATEFLTVLRHEEAHVRSYDPLWSLLLEAVGATFGWRAGVRVLVNKAFTLRELVADGVATENYTRVAGLSGALYKLATPLHPQGVPAFSPNTDRVQKLLDHSWHPVVSWWTWRRVALVTMIAVGFLAAGRLPQATAAATPTLPAEACWLRQMMCRGAATEILLMTPGRGMSPYAW